MLRRRYDKKQFLLFAFIGILVLALTSYLIFSVVNFDSRGVADGEEDDSSFDVSFQSETLDSEIAVILEPQNGTIFADGLKLDLIVDTQGEEVEGIGVTLDYSGDVEYVGFEQGEIENCEVVENIPLDSENSVELNCFFEEFQPTYVGQGDIFASVIFESTAEGMGEINISSVEFSVRDERVQVSFSGESGEYVTTLASAGVQPSCGTLNDEIFAFRTEDWPVGSFCEEGTSQPSSPDYPSGGETASWQCISGTNAVSCSAQREAAPPTCGNLDGEAFTHSQTTWPSESFCLVGEPDPTSPVFPLAGSTTTWQCSTVADSTSCSASKPDILPEASIFSNSGVLIGLALVFLSAILLVYRKRDVHENFSMRNKLCL